MTTIKLTVFLGPDQMKTIEVPNGAMMAVDLGEWAKGARAFRIDAPEPVEDEDLVTRLYPLASDYE